MHTHTHTHTVTLYDCNLMGNNCGQCLAISADYECSYCGPTQSCYLDDKCQGVRYSDVSQFDMCEAPPTIESVSVHQSVLYMG